MKIKRLGIWAALLAFGVAYNVWIERLEAQGKEHGYLAVLVAVGCAVTLAGAAVLVGIPNALLVLMCFVASGTPMTAGSILRYMERRWAEDEFVRRVARREGFDDA